MIVNESQRRISEAAIKRFADAIVRAETDGQSSGVDPLIHAAMISGMRSQLNDLQTQMAEYQALRP